MEYTLSFAALAAANTWLYHRKTCRFNNMKRCSFPTKDTVCDFYGVSIDELELAIKIRQVMQVLEGT